jgi:hypothetical protein
LLLSLLIEISLRIPWDLMSKSSTADCSAC